MISIKIDAKKVKRELFFKGKSTEYMDLTLIDNKTGKDEYGNDGFVVQDVGKEARLRGEKGPIVGNWRHVGGSSQRPAGEASRRPTPPTKRPPQDPDLDGESDTIPF